jgi:hypothetical protein
MNSHPSFQRTCLAALLLAGCCSAIAEPDTGNPVVQEAEQTQATAPVAAPPEAEPATAEIDPAAGMQDEDDSGDAAPVAAIDPATLHGEWMVKEQHPDAGEVVTLFSVNPDSSFAGTMTVAGNVVWSYSGNWYLDGNLITWFYTESTPPLMLVDETEVDEIIAVDSEKLVYLSGKRDVQETLYRVTQ